MIDLTDLEYIDSVGIHVIVCAHANATEVAFPLNWPRTNGTIQGSRSRRRVAVYAGCSMADFLEEKKREIRERLAELKPLVEEYERLEVAAAALDGAPSNGASKPPASTTRRRRASSSTPARRGRPRGSGTRSKQALELVRAQPGITIAELAEAMKIKQNYLYRVLPALAKDGLVTKKGRGWHPKDAA